MKDHNLQNFLRTAYYTTSSDHMVNWNRHTIEFPWAKAYYYVTIDKIA